MWVRRCASDARPSDAATDEDRARRGAGADNSRLRAVVWKQRDELLGTDDLAPILWLQQRFAVRVVGQVVVALRRPSWLPPMDDWNLVAYRLLLPAQLAIPRATTWIDASFSASSGPAVDRSGGVRLGARGVQRLYAGAMVISLYRVRMARRPDARWFGGTIPIVFPSRRTYVYALGSFHVGS